MFEVIQDFMAIRRFCFGEELLLWRKCLPDGNLVQLVQTLRLARRSLCGESGVARPQLGHRALSANGGLAVVNLSKPLA